MKMKESGPAKGARIPVAPLDPPLKPALSLTHMDASMNTCSTLDLVLLDFEWTAILCCRLGIITDTWCLHCVYIMMYCCQHTQRDVTFIPKY